MASLPGPCWAPPFAGGRHGPLMAPSMRATVRVGNRLSIPGTVVKHTLQFHDAAGIDRAAFQFASNLNGTLEG